MVKKKFRDKHTKRVYAVGAVVEMTESRIAEVIANLGDGYIEAEKAKAPSAKPPRKAAKVAAVTAEIAEAGDKQAEE